MTTKKEKERKDKENNAKKFAIDFNSEISKTIIDKVRKSELRLDYKGKFKAKDESE